MFVTTITSAEQIGSKVSFKAVDGKTYTGVVKEIDNNKYKIKYDGFELESWLDKSILTVWNALKEKNFGGDFQSSFQRSKHSIIINRGTTGENIKQ